MKKWEKATYADDRRFEDLYQALQSNV